MKSPSRNIREPSQRLASRVKRRWGKPSSVPRRATTQRRCNNPWGRKGKPEPSAVAPPETNEDGRPPIIIRIRTGGSRPVILPLREKQKCSSLEERAVVVEKRASTRPAPEDVFPGKRARVDHPRPHRPTLVAKRGGFSVHYKDVKTLETSRDDPILAPTVEASTSNFAPKKRCLQQWKQDCNNLLNKNERLKTQDSSSGFSEIDTSAETEVEDLSDSDIEDNPKLVMDLSTKSGEGESEEDVAVVDVKIDKPVWHYSSAYIPPPVNTLANPFLRRLEDTTPKSVVLPLRSTSTTSSEKERNKVVKNIESDQQSCARSLPLESLRLTRDLLAKPPLPKVPAVKHLWSGASKPSTSSTTVSSAGPSKSSKPSAMGVLAAASAKGKMPALLRSPAYLAGYKAALVQGGINPMLGSDGSLEVIVDDRPSKPPVLADVQSAYNGVTNLGFLTDHRPKGLKENVIRRRIIAALEAKTEDVFVLSRAEQVPQVSIPEPSGSAQPFGPMRTTVANFKSPPSLPMVDGQVAQTRVKFQPTSSSRQMTAETAKSVTSEVPSSSRVDSAILPLAHSTDPGRVLLSPNLDILPIHQRVKTSGATLKLQTQVGSSKIPLGVNMRNPRMRFTSPSQYQAWLSRTTWETQNDAFLAVNIYHSIFHISKKRCFYFILFISRSLLLPWMFLSSS